MRRKKRLFETSKLRRVTLRPTARPTSLPQTSGWTYDCSRHGEPVVSKSLISDV